MKNIIFFDYKVMMFVKVLIIMYNYLYRIHSHNYKFGFYLNSNITYTN